MLNGDGGGSGAGEVVCCGGEGGGGMDGLLVRGKPFLISYTTLHSEAYTIPSSSLKGGPINGLYSIHIFP